MKNYLLRIPKPCHEDWSKMTPNEKGKFCSSCAKTVVDFTKKSPQEIQEYLIENRGQRVCGHFYRKQLDSIVIQLPENTFLQPLSFQKLFLLTLLLVMGTTLFSCKTDTGKTQKIEKVELIDIIVKQDSVIDLDSIKGLELDGFVVPISKEDSIKKECKIPPPPTPTTGIVIESTGEVEGEIVEPFDIDKVKELPEEEELEEPLSLQPNDSLSITEIMGAIIEGEVKLVEGPPYSIHVIDNYVRFKEDKNLSEEKAKQGFEKKIKGHVKEKFQIELTENLGLKTQKYKIYTQLIIDAKGVVSDIKVRAPHPKLEKHVIEIVQKLPQFIPAIKDGKKVSVKYTLPITFKIN
ncbi:conserved protein of unknown function [Tenacibaculum sp. 190130A14a]|uniref:Periplasmic protein TonB n=1 Tax=Tenacibaculum polynesiense TaxID=3137857 RepID=A0ABM9PE97_9FLAO